MQGPCPILMNSLKYHHHPLQVKDTIPKDESLRLMRESVKLLTYNLFMRPPLIKTNACDFKEDRLK